MPAVADPVRDLQSALSDLTSVETTDLPTAAADAIAVAVRALQQLEATRGALGAAQTQPTISVDQYAALIGVHRITAYEHAKGDQIPTIKVGNRIRIPSAIVLRQLGIEA